MSINIVRGNLITLALAGEFDVIGHGCNCFCTMQRGIAPQMAAQFYVNEYSLENKRTVGDIDKLGRIEYNFYPLTADIKRTDDGIQTTINIRAASGVDVVNMYTQYHWSMPDVTSGVPLNYAALGLCFQKLNHEFKDKHIGLPWIGCGLAGGNKDHVRGLLELIITDCKVTIVEYDSKI